MKTFLKSYAEVSAGFPFRGSIVPDAHGDALAVQMKDVSRDAMPQWGTMIRTRLTGRKPFPFLQAGDILLLMRGGSYFAVHLAEIPEPAVASPHFFILRVQTDCLLPAFLAWQINHGPAQTYFSQVQAGSVQLSLRRYDVENLPVAIPPLKKQRTIVRLAETCRQQQDILRQKIANTSRLLDGLAFSLHHEL